MTNLNIAIIMMIVGGLIGLYNHKKHPKWTGTYIVFKAIATVFILASLFLLVLMMMLFLIKL